MVFLFHGLNQGTVLLAHAAVLISRHLRQVQHTTHVLIVREVKVGRPQSHRRTLHVQCFDALMDDAREDQEDNSSQERAKTERNKVQLHAQLVRPDVVIIQFLIALGTAVKHQACEDNVHAYEHSLEAQIAFALEELLGSHAQIERHKQHHDVEA